MPWEYGPIAAGAPGVEIAVFETGVNSSLPTCIPGETGPVAALSVEIAVFESAVLLRPLGSLMQTL
jgi:hypothetical protein